MQENNTEQQRVTLFEKALTHEPKTKTLNIADLDIVCVYWLTEHRVAKDKDNKEFEYTVLMRDGKEYRIPPSVLEEIKDLIEEMGKDFQYFKVLKKGTGLDTRYKVVVMPTPKE